VAPPADEGDGAETPELGDFADLKKKKKSSKKKAAFDMEAFAKEVCGTRIFFPPVCRGCASVRLTLNYVIRSDW
jgi:hypothetical protein